MPQNNEYNSQQPNALTRVLFRILTFAVSQFVAELGCTLPEKWRAK